MRPGQIRVFDGLRVTTEHVDHFQASLHSAIQDIREILGLGVIYSGFGVSATGADSITVQPGIAFDRQRNRIVSDEPQILTVAFGADQSVAYVCARYDQVEGGETEGRKTLIWDSCVLSLRPAIPDPKENTLPLAQVTRRDDGTLAITDATPPLPTPPATEPPAATPLVPPELTFRQGVMTFAATPGPPASVSSLLAAAAASSPSTPGGALYAPIGAAELPAGFTWSALTTYAVVAATVSAPSVAESSTRVDATWRATSTGEASIVDGTIAQFALTANGAAAPDLSEGVVLSLALDPATTSVADQLPADVREWLGHVRVCLRLERSGGTAIKAVARLAWSGEWTAQIAQRIAEHNPLLTWTGRLAWKATGRPTP